MPTSARVVASTEARNAHRGARLLLALLAILALVAAWAATPARGDGDPASDVLATGQLFLAQDAAVPVPQQEQLSRVLRETAQDGYPIRVAIIASPTDLGSVTALWRQPREYAQFLGQEVSLTYRGPVLVVMPDGFGLYGFGAGASPARSLAGAAGSRGGLGAAAVSAVQHLASAAGHPVAASQGTTGATATADNASAWITFGIGALLVAIAWIASLRARPLRLPLRMKGVSSR